MQILTESDGVFLIDTGDRQETWISHGDIKSTKHILKVMENRNVWDREALLEYAFFIEEESQCSCTDVTPGEVITDDYLLGVEEGFKLGVLIGAGYTLEELNADDFDVEGNFLGALASLNTVEFTGEESDMELDEKVHKYFNLYGYTSETKIKLFNETEDIQFKNRLKIRFGG